MHHAGVLGLLHDAYHEVQSKLHPSKSHLRHHVTPILYALLDAWWRRSLRSLSTRRAERVCILSKHALCDVLLDCITSSSWSQSHLHAGVHGDTGDQGLTGLSGMPFLPCMRVRLIMQSFDRACRAVPRMLTTFRQLRRHLASLKSCCTLQVRREPQASQV